MCCGQKRSQMQNSLPPRRTPSPPQYGFADRQGVQTQASLPARRTIAPHARINVVNQGVQLTGLAGSTLPSVIVRYLDTAPVQVRGPVTGRSYEFSGSRAVQSVDARDASSLLQTSSFRRA